MLRLQAMILQDSLGIQTLFWCTHMVRSLTCSPITPTCPYPTTFYLPYRYQYSLPIVNFKNLVLSGSFMYIYSISHPETSLCEQNQMGIMSRVDCVITPYARATSLFPVFIIVSCSQYAKWAGNIECYGCSSHYRVRLSACRRQWHNNAWVGTPKS